MILKTFALPPALDNLPDDTEETLVGSSLHQGAITVLATGLTLCGPRRGLPWFIGNQIKMVIPRQGARAPYMPSPDILVHPTLTNGSRNSLILTTDNPPALVVEVASPSTAWSSDLNLTDPRGKPRAYEAIGIPEYIVFDPTCELIPEQIWARRLGPQGYELRGPTAEGHWVSQALGGIAFAPQGFLLRVYDQEGRLVPTSEEMADLLDKHQQRSAEMVDLLDKYQQQNAKMTDLLDKHQQRIAALEAALRRLGAE